MAARRNRYATPTGNQLPHSKLYPEAVRYIRRNWRGLSDNQLADRFGVTRNAIRQVREYRSWRHVDD